MSKLLASLVAIAVFTIAAPVGAETRLVAVAPFGGPESVAGEVRAVVLDVVGARYQVLSTAELERAHTLTGSDTSDPIAALAVARLAGADAVVIGQVAIADDAYSLSMSVLRSPSGESVGAVMVPLGAAEMTQLARGRISRMLGDLLASLDPNDAPPGQTPARPAIRPPAPRSGEVSGTRDGHTVAQARARVVAKRQAERRFPLTFEAAAGLSATARRLSFSQEPGLAADASVSANPSPGFRLEGEASTAGDRSIGLAVSLERSINAGVALGGSDGVELPVTQMQWGAALRGRMRYRKIWVPSLDLGYRELKYEIGVRPPGLLVPNSSYGMLDIGAGLRVELGRVAVLAGARYLHTIATSGITDTAAFGPAGSHGTAAEAGLEVEVLESIFVRVAVRYLRFVLDFDGSGDLAVGLDGDADQDVIGAVDAYIGGTAQVVFRF